jgi:hypothetical protein
VSTRSNVGTIFDGLKDREGVVAEEEEEDELEGRMSQARSESQQNK